MFHILNSNIYITSQSKKGFVRKYVKMGANEKWLEENVDRLIDGQNLKYISGEELVESGFVDELLENEESFRANYSRIERSLFAKD